MGAAARAMANFGLRDLVLVAPYDVAWQTARSARAGAEILARARAVASLGEAVADCTQVVGTTAGTARTPELPIEDWNAIAASLPVGRIALLFGSEKTGLGVEEISFCQRLARIGTALEAPSMNLGQAVAICAYELSRRPAAPATAAPQDIDVATRERVLDIWYPLLVRLGASQPQHEASQKRALREMLWRWR
ncbi:MAG: TrmH family RNA methyltransferase, partial [Terriglobales bacterium]